MMGALLTACAIESSIANPKEIENLNNLTEQEAVLAPDSNPDSNIMNTHIYSPDSVYFDLGFRYGEEGIPSLSSVFADPNCLSNLKACFADFRSQFDYVHVHTQFLTHEGFYDKDEKFVAGMQANENSDGSYHTKIKTFFIDEKMIDPLADYIEIGENFTSDDFQIYDSNQEINVILGNGYRELYSVGDKLELSLHQKPLILNVIGFFKEDMNISVNERTHHLDNTILLPFYDINYIDETDEIDTDYQKIYYTQKLGGSFYAGEKNDVPLYKKIHFDNPTVEDYEAFSEELDAHFADVLALVDKYGFHYSFALYPITHYYYIE